MSRSTGRVSYIHFCGIIFFIF
jgi:hypothetical protein